MCMSSPRTYTKTQTGTVDRQPIFTSHEPKLPHRKRMFIGQGRRGHQTQRMHSTTTYASMICRSTHISLHTGTDPEGPPKLLTRIKFLSTISLAAKVAGIKPLSGHSIRISSTLKYLLCNLPFEVVKTKGKWASDAFLIYLCRHAQILAPYMQASPEIHETFMCFTLPLVQSHAA